MQSQKIRTKRIHAHLLFGLLMERLAFVLKKQLLSQKTFAAEPGSIYALRTSHVTAVSRFLTRGSKDLNLVWARMLWSSYALRTRTLLWFGHGCSGHRTLLEHERYYGLGTYALVIVCSSNTNVIMVWAWMLWSWYALGARTLLWARLAMDEVQIRILFKPEHEP